MKCLNCHGTDIKSRRNYSHGNKSRSITTKTCAKCGSTKMEQNVSYRRRKK